MQNFTLYPEKKLYIGHKFGYKFKYLFQSKLQGYPQRIDFNDDLRALIRTHFTKPSAMQSFTDCIEACDLIYI